MKGFADDTRVSIWKMFFVVALGVFMATMDSSMVNIALPSIMAEFQSPLQSTQWVVLIYLLTITASLLLWGHFSDLFGRRKVYSWGLLFFATGSLSCSLAPSLFWLLRSFAKSFLAPRMVPKPTYLIKKT